MDEESFSLDGMFTPPRPPTPPPTLAIYQREKARGTGGGWSEIGISLVGNHPLWGHYLWNASRAFASFLDSNRLLYVGRTVLELGAGGGLPGILAAKNGARKVVLTDYPDAPLIDNLRKNVEENLREEERIRVSVLGYTWGHPVESLLQELVDADSRSQPDGFDVVIMSDLVFNHSQHDALLDACELSLSSRRGDAATDGSEPCLLAFYSHHRPHLAEHDLGFFRKAEARGWLCKEIVTEKFTPMFPEDPGEEEVRATVHGWKLTRGATKNA
ncbi:putative methyltransferase-domain-containing protein [Vararia minispora EC-137]|uniref:Methyltransferase-domain-containing protein n=1 Tax=Vararia minispora EC-137 TaxID=1314806 RepID=A0ACB8QSJ3_9AGAM|nr:putative methyltransferase-domain-containing protein [Vararia minispora EC-137]